MNTSNVVGLILAGGRSLRMGCDKAYLRFQNQTFLERAYQCLKQAGLDTILVSGCHEGYRCIQDRWPNAGPAAAIISAVTDPVIQNKQHLLVMPIDIPLFPSAHLKLLMKTIEAHSTEASYFKDHPLPCCLQINALKKLLSTNGAFQDISMKKLLTHHLRYQMLTQDPEAQEGFTNINTPESLSQLRTHHET